MNCAAILTFGRGPAVRARARPFTGRGRAPGYSGGPSGNVSSMNRASCRSARAKVLRTTRRRVKRVGENVARRIACGSSRRRIGTCAGSRGRAVSLDFFVRLTSFASAFRPSRTGENRSPRRSMMARGDGGVGSRGCEQCTIAAMARYDWPATCASPERARRAGRPQTERGVVPPTELCRRRCGPAAGVAFASRGAPDFEELRRRRWYGAWYRIPRPKNWAQQARVTKLMGVSAQRLVSTAPDARAPFRTHPPVQWLANARVTWDRDAPRGLSSRGVS